ncbi:hypothetical protein [Rickettsia montanensis]|uniref:Uncharacterized protein n=1 Tax=Rickettsia montanensis (strain OSU 85-930) TaxID=1105114 RepID=H8KCK6_RICMS|nr:hypothetical protein [Rickettsia montanensis]AFC73464.1 hypothetical protein MCI_02885 [Rickettsia montanensis str. OSU 85-930]
MTAHFEELQDFHQNLDNLNFLVPLQKYIPECQPKDYKSFVNLEAITWNRFLVKYQKLFENIQKYYLASVVIVRILYNC